MTKHFDDDSNSHEPGDYPVGYKKPPVHTRFKPGQSGNPRGRPKRKPTESERLRKVLESRLPITENGKKKSLPVSEVVLKQLGKQSAEGKLAAIRLLFKIMEQLNIGKLENDGRFTLIIEGA
jgi:hypothetical protein